MADEQLESPDPLVRLLRRVEELEWRIENLERQQREYDAAIAGLAGGT